MVGTAYFPGGEEQAYRCDERDDLCLVGTAEVPVTALHPDEILRARELPRRYVALSLLLPARGRAPTARTRAGSTACTSSRRSSRSSIDVADERASLEHHHAILENAEELLQALELPYRVVNVCGGDLGQPQVQKFDIETWMPSREGYGETHSASRFHDFQARRLNLRYRDEDGQGPLLPHAQQHGRASPRILIALLENHQQRGRHGRDPRGAAPLSRRQVRARGAETLTPARARLSCRRCRGGRRVPRPRSCRCSGCGSR